MLPSESVSKGGPSGTASPAATRSEIRAPTMRCAPPEPVSAGDGPGLGGVVASSGLPPGRWPPVVHGREE